MESVERIVRIRNQPFWERRQQCSSSSTSKWSLQPILRRIRIRQHWRNKCTHCLGTLCVN